MDDAELSRLDGPAFIAERRRVRDALDTRPPGEGDSLREQYARVEAEFLRRAGMGWQRVS